MLYENGIRDTRVREYLPVQRIVWQQGCSHAEDLPGRMEIQPGFDAYRVHTHLEIADGGGVLLDFGTELHGGIRLLCDSDYGARIRLRFGESASEAMGTPE